MKTIKRIALSILSIVTVATLYGCNSDNNTSSLMEHGLEIVEQLDSIAKHDSYTKLYSSMDEIVDTIHTIGEGNYSKPSAVFKISATDQTFSEVITLDEYLGLPEELQTRSKSRYLSSVLNDYFEVNGNRNLALAINTICYAETSFIFNEFEEEVFYLYVYESATPIYVFFQKSGENIVKATGGFFFIEDTIEYTEYGLDEYFYQKALEVELIK